MKKAPSLSFIFLFVFGALSLPACHDPIQEEIDLGREAVTQNQLEEAHQHFDQVLQQEPQNYHAKWGKADVYRRQELYDKEAQILEAILLEKEYQPYFEVVRPALDRNYRKRAELEKNENQIAQLERKAIEQEPLSVANGSLADRLFAQGLQAKNDGQPRIALERFREAQSLRISDRLQKEIEQQKGSIELILFKEDYLSNHSNLLKNRFASYDSKQSLFTLSISFPIDHPCNSSCKLTADKNALAKIDQKLAQLTHELTPSNQEKDQSIQYDPATLQIIKKTMKAPKKASQKGEYSLTVTVPLDEVLRQIYRDRP